MLQSHTPPILSSPARLGLTNPNSPSLTPNSNSNSNPNPNPNTNPNPNPNPKPPSSSAAAQHHHVSTTSSTLLSLLPPLPRGQSLLLQMASLATKLFEVSPNRAAWLASFRGSLPSFLASSSQSQTLTLDQHHPSSTKEVLSIFTSLQTQLFESVAELQEILDLQDSKVKISRDIRSNDSTLLAFTKKIREAEQVLDHLVDDYSDYRRNPKRSKRERDQEDYNSSSSSSSSLSSSLDLNDILAYAHRISYTTFAPPEHGAGLAPLRGALPPAPQDNEMRASQLYHFADLDVGVPKKATEAKERAVDMLAEALIQQTPLREESLATMPPPLLPIAVPSGWRKGMPVELPTGIPPVPLGWKPGDPVPLPPMDGVVAGSMGEEQRLGGVPMLPGAPAVPPKAPEAIQVKFVQLDINPDQDDYSSDYSSEVGSSDEDDED